MESDYKRRGWDVRASWPLASSASRPRNDPRADPGGDAVDEAEILRRNAAGTVLDEAHLSRVVELVRRTRSHPDVRVGSSVRGVIDLVLVASTLARLRGAAATDPEVTLDAALTALSGRMRLHEGSASTAEDVVRELWQQVFAPRPEAGEDGPGEAPRPRSRVDRVKDMINSGGENVYCVEVENALVAAPGVFEVSVVGVPDEMMGEKVGAIVVPTPGSTFDREAFLAHARSALADFKVPQYLSVLQDVLPRNPSGKVLKSVLRQQTEWEQPLR